MPHPARTLLAIPQPCAESWEAMTPTGPGRRCAACQKVVVDFSQKTDAELLAYLRQATGQPTCGRLRPDQLNRALHPAAPVSRWRAWLASALALGGVLGAGRATAQTRSNYAGPLPATVSPVATGAVSAPVVASTQAATSAALVRTAPGAVQVSGLVLDAESGQPLPGVTILVKGTNLGTSTDSAGQFKLNVPGVADSLRLSIMSIGYTTQQAAVLSGNQLLRVHLHADRMVLGGLVPVTCVLYERRPWPWHARAFYQWGRYWLTRPFRRE